APVRLGTGGSRAPPGGGAAGDVPAVAPAQPPTTRVASTAIDSASRGRLWRLRMRVIAPPRWQVPSPLRPRPPCRCAPPRRADFRDSMVLRRGAAKGRGYQPPV